MDTAISRMMKLVAILLVSGFAAAAALACQHGYWGFTWLFAAGSAIGAGAFTIVWSVTVTSIAELLGNKSRADVTSKNVIGSSVAFVSLIATVTFIATALTAMLAGNFESGGWLIATGLVANVALTVIWCMCDYSFVQTMAKKN